MTEETEFVFTEWLAEGVKGMALYVPRRAATFLRAALREALLADRAVVNKAIEYLEEEPGPRKARRITVE